MGSPGDLSIGIPGLGAISLPSGWWTQIIVAALAAAGDTGPQAQTYETNAQEAADLHDGDTQAGTNAAVSQALVSNNMTGTYIDASFNKQLTNVPQTLFEPQSATITQFENTLASLINWGPYHFIIDVESLFTMSPGDGKINGVGLGVPDMGVNTTFAPQLVGTSSGTSVVSPGTWYWTGGTHTEWVAFVESVPDWPLFRAIVGGIVWLAFASFVINYLAPKQVA